MSKCSRSFENKQMGKSIHKHREKQGQLLLLNMVEIGAKEHHGKSKEP